MASAAKPSSPAVIDRLSGRAKTLEHGWLRFARHDDWRGKKDTLFSEKVKKLSVILKSRFKLPE
jgi:hypothetical protein